MPSKPGRTHGYAMRQRGGQVMLDPAARPGEGRSARWRVIDRGEGIPAAHGIVRQHDGAMDESSIPFEHTVFTVLLPLA